MEEERMYDLKDLDGEIWKDIEGYEGYYQVSNLGRVKSLDRVDCRGQKRKGEIKILSLSPQGYVRVKLHKDREYEVFGVHRLVASAFIPNPDNLPQVNHKDEIRTNNKVDNLEWCTIEYNINYGTRTEKVIKKLNKIIYQYDLEGNFIKEYPSKKEASELYNIDSGSISKCCSGKYNTAGGYIWSYEKLTDKEAYERGKKSRKIYQYDLQGNLIKEWDSCRQCAKILNISNSNINSCCNGKLKTYKGFIWSHIRLDN